MSKQLDLPDVDRAMSRPREVLEYQGLLDYLILDGGLDKCTAILVAHGTPVKTAEQSARFSVELKRGIIDGKIAPGIGKRLCKLSDDELTQAEKIYLDKGCITGDDLGGLRKATRDEAVKPLSDLFRVNPIDDIEKSMRCLVKRYPQVEPGQFREILEQSLLSVGV